MVRVLIADPHPIVREGLRELINSMPGFHVEDETGDGRDVTEKVAAKRIALLILDLQLPGREGLEVLQDLKRCRSKVRSLVFTRLPEKDYALRALKAGAAGYFLDTGSASEFIKVVKTVASGAKFLSPATQEIMLNLGEAGGARPLHELLSNRELQVLKLIGRGMGPKSIGHELGVSPRTSTSYRARVLTKFQMLTDADLVLYVRAYLGQVVAV